MKVKSIRLPEEIDKAINYVAKSEKLEKTTSLRKLTRMGFETYVAKSYEKGKTVDFVRTRASRAAFWRVDVEALVKFRYEYLSR